MHILTSKRIISMFGGVALMGSALLSSALPAMADQAPDKNGPGVARVSMISGSAVVQRGDSNEQVAAVLNAPLLPGDYISTGATSRAEVQFDGTTAVRLGGNVQARITNNDPNDRQLQLADGTIEVGVVHQGTPLQIDTPSVSMRAAGVGDYRVSIGRDGSSWVTVRRGQAEISTPQRTYTLDTGRTMVARGSASDPSITYTSEVGYDSFDDFSAKRDEKMIAALDASPNLNPDIAGYDNLAQYGQWQDVPGYGNSWIPNEPSGWSPYHDGDWSWEDGYGWTWVGSEPWGWAPYHYGRWYYANNYGWAWAPPAYGAAAAWSPALVGFFGFGLSFGGPGWGVSLGFGDGGYGGYGGGYPYIGWCPLPPAAPYYPWYPGWAWTGYGWGYPYYGGYGWGGTRYVSITNIYNNYYHHGGSGTLVGNFQHGRLSGHVITVDPHKVGRIGGIQGAVPVTPTHENLGFGGRTISAPVTLSRAFRSPRFAENRAIAARTPFERQQQAVSRALRANAGRFNAPVTSGRNNGTGRIDGNGRQNQPAGSWARFNQDRGNQYRGNQDRGNVAGARQNGNYDPGRVSGFGRSEAGTGRQDNAAGDSWGRFSRDRGNVSGTYDRVNGNNNGRGYNNAGNRGYGNPYERSAYPSYARPSNSSYARPSNPSYSRGSYDRGGYGSPYTRNSYPSYARPSYPSPSRGSYSAAPREAYPSYSRGGGGGYSAPHASGGGYSAPRQSGNGGGGGGERGNGGGGNGRGGGRPPQQKP